MAELVMGPIDVARLLAEAPRPDCGAISLFLGTTRDHHGGRRVTRLAYEAYEKMALAALEKLESDACAKFEIATCRITHRLGEVPASEASVAVVVVAVHRGPAFDASRWAMDELKRSVPIWKREVYEDGAAEWAAGRRLEP